MQERKVGVLAFATCFIGVCRCPKSPMAWNRYSLIELVQTPCEESHEDVPTTHLPESGTLTVKEHWRGAPSVILKPLA